jgi:hypothetical protein
MVNSNDETRFKLTKGFKGFWKGCKGGLARGLVISIVQFLPE